MKYLKDRIGEEILGFIPIIDKQIFQVLVLHGVEEGGIWVESENLTQMMLSSLKQAGSSKTPYFSCHFIKSVS